MKPETDSYNLENILRNWEIEFLDVKKRILLYGSPERSIYRFAITSKDSSIYVLEKISPEAVDRKNQIAQNILELKRNSLLPLAVNYLQNNKGSFLTLIQNEYWLLSPYISGIYLDQTKYLSEDWRGQVMADFLLDLRKAQSINRVSSKMEIIYPVVSFIGKMEETMRQYNHNELIQSERVLTYLKDSFFKTFSKLPLSFCHGDYHSANIVWGRDSIRGVIDWEFCGYQPELYDAANMIGCLGMENPEAFGMKISQIFLEKLQTFGSFSEISWKNFFDLILAIRFAWLSEWFRKKDTEMIELEIVYMNLLLDNKEEIKSLWS